GVGTAVRVVESAACTGAREEVVGWHRARGGRGRREAGDLRLLHRQRRGKRAGLDIAPALLDAEGRLTLPAEADQILRIDRVGQLLGAVRCAYTVLGHQRPHLAAGDGEAARGLRLAPDLALPQRVAVALVVVGGGSRTQEVGLEVAGQLVRAGVAFKQAAQAALPSAKVQLADVAFVRAGHRDGVEWRVDVGVHRVLPPHAFRREEGDRSDGDALVVDRGG